MQLIGVADSGLVVLPLIRQLVGFKAERVALTFHVVVAP